MSQQDHIEIEDEQPEPEKGEDNLKKLREKAKASDDLRAELEQIKRERAWEKAGVDTDHPLAKTLMPTYDGELDPDAVKAWLTARGADAVFVKVEPEPEKVEVPEEEKQAAQERQALAGGAEPSGPVEGAPPWDMALDDFVKLHQGEGRSREDAMGSALSHIWEAAQKGDPRVVYQDSMV